MSVVSVHDVQHVAHLARIELEPAAIATFVSQLDAILAYVRQLQQVPTDGVGPTSHVLPLANITRPDQLQPSLTPHDVQAMAPAMHGQLVKVPKVVDS